MPRKKISARRISAKPIGQQHSYNTITIIHIHKLLQMYKMSYEKAYKKYGHLIDEKGMIDTEELQLQNTI
tara:strand:- start:124 stop:333 length:210 start_codon:yes stop_codon:yes gene_type:complete